MIKSLKIKPNSSIGQQHEKNIKQRISFKSADEICYVSGKKVVISDLLDSKQTFLDLDIEGTISGLIVTIAFEGLITILVSEQNRLHKDSTIHCFTLNDQEEFAPKHQFKVKHRVDMMTVLGGMQGSMFVAYSYEESENGGDMCNLLQVYRLDEKEQVGQYKVKGPLENVELEKIMPQPKNANHLLVFLEEGVQVLILDLNGDAIQTVCLMSHQSIKNSFEKIHDVSIVPYSGNFDPIVCILTNECIQMFEDFKHIGSYDLHLAYHPSDKQLKVEQYSKMGRNIQLCTKQLRTDMDELIREVNNDLAEKVPAYNKRSQYEGTFFTGEQLFITCQGYGVMVIDSSFNMKLWEINQDKQLALVGSQCNQHKFGSVQATGILSANQELYDANKLSEKMFKERGFFSVTVNDNWDKRPETAGTHMTSSGQLSSHLQQDVLKCNFKAFYLDLKECKEGITRFKQMHGMDLHRLEVQSSAYDYTKNILVTLADDSCIKFYKDTEQGCLKLIGQVKHTEKVTNILIDPTGEQMLLYAATTVVIAYLIQDNSDKQKSNTNSNKAGQICTRVKANNLDEIEEIQFGYRKNMQILHKNKTVKEYHIETFRVLREVELQGAVDYFDIYPLTEHLLCYKSEDIVLVNNTFNKCIMMEAKKLRQNKRVRQVDQEGLIVIFMDKDVLVMVDLQEYLDQCATHQNSGVFHEHTQTLDEHNSYLQKNLNLDDEITKILANWHIGLLFLTGKKGILYVFDYPHINDNYLKVNLSNTPIIDIYLSADRKTIYTVSSDGVIYDLKYEHAENNGSHKGLRLRTEKGHVDMMKEIIIPEVGQEEPPKVYMFGQPDNLFQDSYEKDVKKNPLRHDNGPIPDTKVRIQETILVSSENCLCKNDINTINDKTRELKNNETLVNKIFGEISKQFVIEEKNIKSMKAIFYNQKKDLDEKLRITRNSITEDNKVFIGNFEKITYLMEQDFIKKIKAESTKAKELQNIKDALQKTVDEKIEEVKADQSTQLQTDKNNQEQILAELKHIKHEILDEYRLFIEDLKQRQKIHKDQLEENKMKLFETNEHRLENTKKHFRNLNSQKINVKQDIDHMEKQSKLIKKLTEFKEMLIKKINNNIERENKKIEEACDEKDLGELDPKAKASTQSLMDRREKLVQDRDRISHEIEDLSKKELYYHNVIKDRNERMYYLEFSNTKLTKKLGDLRTYREDLQRILFDEKLQTNEQQAEMEQLESTQSDASQLLNQTNKSSSEVTQMIENSKFLISRMQRENDFVQKLKGMKALMRRLDQKFAVMSKHNPLFKAKQAENHVDKLEMQENNLKSKSELSKFKIMKDILKEEQVFVNRKIDTLKNNVKKTQRVMKINKTKFTKDENFLLNNQERFKKDEKFLNDDAERLQQENAQGPEEADEYEQTVQRKEKGLKASAKLTDPKLLDHRDKTFNRIVNWKPKQQQPYLERINKAKSEADLRRKQYQETYNAQETLDSINEMGAKLSNLDSKMIDFFRSYTHENYEQNERILKDKQNRIESIERLIQHHGEDHSKAEEIDEDKMKEIDHEELKKIMEDKND